LLFRPESGWCIADRGSSNGTKLNDHRLQPDVEMSIKNGDIVTIANVVLKVVISVN
jgi:pSer/pThr/pTyr-binding forkhead associated (FHA) protein